jgi:hypothetical protein
MLDEFDTPQEEESTFPEATPFRPIKSFAIPSSPGNSPEVTQLPPVLDPSEVTVMSTNEVLNIQDGDVIFDYLGNPAVARVVRPSKNEGKGYIDIALQGEGVKEEDLEWQTISKLNAWGAELYKPGTPLVSDTSGIPESPESSPAIPRRIVKGAPVKKLSRKPRDAGIGYMR